MYKLLVQQKLFSLGEKFTITDELGNPKYYVQGSVFEIPKNFIIYDMNEQPLAKVERVLNSFFLPRFTLSIHNEVVARINKEFSFLPKYSIEGKDIKINGNFFGMDFEILHNEKKIGSVNKSWFKLADQYAIEIDDSNKELLVLGIVLAIDYVKRLQDGN